MTSKLTLDGISFLLTLDRPPTISNETMELLYEAYTQALLSNQTGNGTVNGTQQDELSPRIDVGTLTNVASFILSNLVQILQTFFPFLLFFLSIHLGYSSNYIVLIQLSLFRGGGGGGRIPLPGSGIMVKNRNAPMFAIHASSGLQARVVVQGRSSN